MGFLYGSIPIEHPYKFSTMWFVSIKYCHVDTENSPACLLSQTAVWFRPRPGPSSHSYCYRVFSEVVLFSDLAAVFVHA